ncbi:MAG: hypothetical protein EA398_00910, partial [Deltaproteobacteria bacterium]
MHGLLHRYALTPFACLAVAIVLPACGDDNGDGGSVDPALSSSVGTSAGMTPSGPSDPSSQPGTGEPSQPGTGEPTEPGTG